VRRAPRGAAGASRRCGRLALACLSAALYTAACVGTEGQAPAGTPAAGVAAPASPQSPRGKRVGPAKVAPVVVGDLRIEVLPWGKARGLGQNGGYIAAFDRDSGKELWVLKVYEVHYDPKLEPDAQDVFISALSKALFGAKLNVTDELGRKYVVDVLTRTVQAR